MTRNARNLLGMLVLSGMLAGQAGAEVVLSTDFTGRTVSGPTAGNITWITNGVQDPGSLTVINEPPGSLGGLFNTANAADHFAVNKNIENNGPWSVTIPLTLTVPGISLQDMAIDWQHFNGSGAFQSANRIGRWTVSVTGSSSGLLDTVTATGPNATSGIENLAFTSPVALSNAETYDLKIYVDSPSTTGNNTGFDGLTLNGSITGGGGPGPATLVHDATDQVSNNHSSFNLSVFPGKAGYDDGTDSGVFGDGTVLDYRFFDSPGNTFNGTGYADGGAGLVSTATATNTNGNGESWANAWTTNDPGTDFAGGDPPNFPDNVNTFARSQGVTGTVDISGLESGTLYFIYGSYSNPNTVALTMTGAGQPDVLESHTEDPPAVNQAWISSFDFANAALYDTISWTYTNTDTDGSRARFMGVIVDGVAAAAVPEPSTFVLAALGLLGLAWFGRRRRRLP